MLNMLGVSIAEKKCTCRYSLILVSLWILTGLLSTHVGAQTAEPVLIDLSLPTTMAVKPAEKQTKTFQIRYASALDIQNMAIPLLNPTGRISRDDRTNLLIVVDTDEVIKKIGDLVNAVDIPLDTVIIPIKFADVQDVARVINKASPRAKINVDTKMNSIIITDIPSNMTQIKNLIDQMESSLSNQTQLGLDCSIIKITLDDKHSTGLDWSKCPYIRKADNISAIFLEKVEPEKLLEWLNKSGTADLISRKKVTVTPNEETRVREGIRYQYTDKSPLSMDTLGTLTYKMSTRGEDFGFTYRFVAKPTDNKTAKNSLIISFSVDGVLPQSGSTAAYGISVNNAQIPDGMTMVTEDIRGIPVVEESNPNKVHYDNVDLLLLITPHSLQQSVPEVKK